MSLTSINNTSTMPLATSSSSRTERSDAATAGVGATLAGLATAATEGVSATVSFSGKALHALEQAGEATVDGIEDAAIGAWHAVQHAATGAQHVGEAIVDAVSDGVGEIVSTAKSVGKELGHYAEVGLSATGEAMSEVASGTVMAASAVGKTLSAMI
jgi:hypothetical protein